MQVLAIPIADQPNVSTLRAELVQSVQVERDPLLVTLDQQKILRTAPEAM